MTKINEKTETYNYWALLTNPVDYLEQVNSTIEKGVRFADDIVTEPKVSASMLALKWKCMISNHKE